MPNAARVGAMTTPISRAAIAVALAFLVTSAVSACSGNSGTSSGASSATSSASASSTGTGALKTTNLVANDVAVTGSGTSLSAQFPVPSSAEKLTTRDLTVGSGTAAKEGDAITVDYYLAGALTGKKIESSFGTGEPASFPLVDSAASGYGVITGWVQGIAGMKPGGQRVIVVPAQLAYGPEGDPPTISPNETLVFVVQLVKVGP